MLDVPRSANLFHVLKDEATALLEDDKREATNYQLMIPVRSRMLRTATGIKIHERTNRQDVLKQLHILDPLICGSSEPLGE